MGLVYATRDATADELDLFRLMLSTFRDGSGIEREDDGTTRAGWRQIERCVAALLGAMGGEDKGIFDVIALDDDTPTVAYGFSVKSKQLSKTEFRKLSTGGQVYMEIANSPAKFWAEISANHGLTEQNFRNREFAEELGSTVIATVEKWHREGATEFERSHPRVLIDLEKSCYFCLSYSKEPVSDNRRYQIHIFPLEYPNDITWRFKSNSCLSGYVTTANGTEIVLVDWYGLSGGQLKYYPPASDAFFASPTFELKSPVALEDLRVRARNTRWR